MKRRSTAYAVAAVLALVTISSVHAASFDTPDARLKYVKKQRGYDTLKTVLGCEDITLQYQTTEMDGGFPYDIYRATGCGMQVQVVATAYRQKSGGYIRTSWYSGVAAPDEEFEAAATSQLESTASFDLGCKDTKFSILHSVRTPLHNEYIATIGAMGCDKKVTYDSTCKVEGVKNGKADIVCVHSANASPAVH
jgi:hypothetical protein